MLNSWIRRKAFWTLDWIKGSPIRKQYADIKRLMSLSPSEVKKVQQIYLKRLVNHAIRTTPYYRGIEFKSIESFPVVNKNIIKENYEEFQSSKFLSAPKHSMSTSGSTGTPFTILQDMRKRNRVLADLIFFNEIIGQQIGDRFCFFRVWTEKDLKAKQNRKVAMLAKNMIPVDIASLDDINMEKIRQLLKKDKTINELLGYASTHKRLVQYIEQCNDSPLDFNIRVIVSGSEMLESAARKKMQKRFNCSVVSRYSNQENGVLAQQCKDSEEYHLNTASYYFEILELDSDKPAKPGEIGRIVVTDLFNYAMPMIRYDTGDLAIAGTKAECGWATQVLLNLQGRRVDICKDPNGKMLSPFLLDKFMEQFDRLAQFQFIQEEKNKYVLKINDPLNLYTDEQFGQMLRQLLGENAKFTIERVAEIPCMESGKFKQMICKI